MRSSMIDGDAIVNVMKFDFGNYVDAPPGDDIVMKAMLLECVCVCLCVCATVCVRVCLCDNCMLDVVDEWTGKEQVSLCAVYHPTPISPRWHRPATADKLPEDCHLFF